ncbi:hypothetical protein [Parabacteroides distasonis]|uniref:hypothetical protein n=1 Tax=Parabacteroides distasonis TaxID=823 RepID=UPI0018A9AC80|nr:hypothetical protein [Parabacteroides distasonis]
MLTINNPHFTIALKTPANARAKKYCHRVWMLTSTTVEPAIVKKYSRKEMLRYLLTLKKGKGVKDYKSHLYLGSLKNGFRDVYSAKKDLFPMGLFQFGALKFPETNNLNISKLVLYQISTVKHDMDTLILLGE